MQTRHLLVVWGGLLAAGAVLAWLAVVGCSTPVRPSSTNPPSAGSDRPSGQEQLDIAGGSNRRILARLVDPANPREWVLNILGISPEERDSYHFLWDLGDSTRMPGAMVRHTYARAGLYNVTLQATDPSNRPAYVLSQVVAVGQDADGTSTALLVLFEGRVNYGVTPPTIWAKAVTTALESGETVEFAWAMSDGSTATGPELNHPLTGTEPFRVSVTATTSLGRTASYFRYFSPTGEELYDPAGGDIVADAGADQTVAPGDTVTLDGSGSTYSGQAPVTFRWAQIAGPAVALKRDDRPLVHFTAPAADSQPVLLEFRLTLASGDQSASDTVRITVAPTMALAGTPFYGMQVVSVLSEENSVTVTTSGGVYQMRPDGIDAWRRIAPATNSVNPRKVAMLTFAPSLGAFAVESADRRSCVLRSAGGLRVQINSDSLVFLENTGASLRYTYTSLLPNPPWAKGSNGDFYYNDGDGGTCHYMHPDSPGTYGGTAGVPNTFTITLATGQSSAFGVFPPREFNFKKLYGGPENGQWVDARPTVAHLYAYSSIRPRSECEGCGSAWETRWYDGRYKPHGVGVFSLFNFLFYLNIPSGENETYIDYDTEEYASSTPIYNKLKGRWEYVFEQPELIHRFVRQAHANGFKVTTYFSPPQWRTKSLAPVHEITAWMREFQTEYDLDGWYLDGVRFNTSPSNWLESYQFLRQVREDVGDEGHLWLHTSVDPWGLWSGRVFVHGETYGDMTLQGETSAGNDPVGFGLAYSNSPNDPWYQYYASGYGSSQAIGSILRMYSGNYPRTSLREEDRARLMGSAPMASRLVPNDLYHATPYRDIFSPAFSRTRNDLKAAFYSHGEPGYIQAFLAGANGFPFWPLSWYKELDPLPSINVVSPTQAVISFRTDTNAVASVHYIAEDPRFTYAFDDKIWIENKHVTLYDPANEAGSVLKLVKLTTPTTVFTVPLNNLTPGTTYYVRIRCSPSSTTAEFDPNAATVYGAFAQFQTPKEE